MLQSSLFVGNSSRKRSEQGITDECFKVGANHHNTMAHGTCTATEEVVQVTAHMVTEERKRTEPARTPVSHSFERSTSDDVAEPDASAQGRWHLASKASGSIVKASWCWTTDMWRPRRGSSSGNTWSASSCLPSCQAQTWPPPSMKPCWLTSTAARHNLASDDERSHCPFGLWTRQNRTQSNVMKRARST